MLPAGQRRFWSPFGAVAPLCASGVSALYRVTTEPLSADALADAVTVPEAGGVCVFLGVVRNTNAGRSVVALEYEAHEPMAEAKLEEIGESVYQRWPEVKQVALVHRIGRLGIGEASVVIAVAAAHRRDAFEACHFAIDRLKQTVPIWKREVFEDGAVWVGLQGESPPA
jgi:molybdopterin synthase catalytic subunit